MSTIIFAENPEIAEILIQNCAAVNLKNKQYRSTPLHIAAFYGNSRLHYPVPKISLDLKNACGSD